MKTKFLEALAPKIQTIDVEGYGSVRLRELTVAENDGIRDHVKAMPDSAHSEVGLRVLVASALDDDGQPLLGEDDLVALRQSSGPRVERLVFKALEVNGQLAAAQVDAAKNASAPIASGASASA